MSAAIWFEQIPLWALFVSTIILVLLSITIGYGLGIWRRKHASEDLSGPTGSVVGAMLALLAFILAFTFGISATRFDTRKQLLLNEVNAIGTTFLRASLIAEPYGADSRKLLKKYVDTRVSLAAQPIAVLAAQPGILLAALAESEKLQNDLWRQAEGLAKAGYNAEIESLFIQSLNEMIDLHTERVTLGLQYRIPLGVWEVLFLMTFFTMVAVGYQFGISKVHSYVIYCFLAVGFALLIMIIADLDSTTRGKLKLNQQPMIDLQKRLNAAN
jgi:hypothetical protein